MTREPVGPERAGSTRGWAAAGVAVAAGLAIHVAPGAVAWRSARCRLLPRLSGVGAPDHVALTFDDGPDPRSTPAILDTLDRLGWRATFFCLGSQASSSPGLVRDLVDRGHEIGVHGYEHTSHIRRPAAWTVPDVRRARDMLEGISGVPAHWFRPPYGALSTSALAASRRSGLQLVLWTTWGKDWKSGATGLNVAAHIRRTFRPGATVLLHDSDVTSAPGSWRSALDALPYLADEWNAAGLRVGPLREHGMATSEP